MESALKIMSLPVELVTCPPLAIVAKAGSVVLKRNGKLT